MKVDGDLVLARQLEDDVELPLGRALDRSRIEPADAIGAVAQRLLQQFLVAGAAQDTQLRAVS